MVKTLWKTGVNYKKGDVVYITDFNSPANKYYICTLSHVADALINPRCLEEIYWVEISSDEFTPTIPPFSTSSQSFTLDIEQLLGPLLNVHPDRRELIEEEAREKTPEEISEESYKKKKQTRMKRKITNIDNEINIYKKKRKIDNNFDLEDQIKLLNVDIETKMFLLDKNENIKKACSSDSAKGKTWLKTVLNLPFGKHVPFNVKAGDDSDKINSYFKTIRDHLDSKIHNMDHVKDEIMEYLARKISNPKSKGHVLALCGSPGTGKCFSKDTPILMFDGTIKMVQDIVPGEKLMGDDSTPRTVLRLGNGRDTMYKITNVKGESYIVNSEHILCLKYSHSKCILNDKKSKRFRVNWFNHKDVKINNKDFYYNKKDINVILEKAKAYLYNLKEEKICEIPIKKYLKLSKSMKDSLKGYSVPVEFHEKELDFDPYIIGLLLGNGSHDGTGITTQDAIILKYLSSTLPKYECYLQYNGSEYNYRINGLKSNGWIGGNNKMLNTLKQYDMIKNKHIPHIYKCNSRENRLKVLAGLLDSVGNLDKNKTGYEFSQSLEHEQIIDDIIYLCRSLGFACYKNKKQTTWTYKGIKRHGEAWRICISGKGIEHIPVLCPRKKANPRQQIKDVLVSGIKVEELQEDNYYGFMIDGNERFVLGNFIVTHNTKILQTLGEALNIPFYQINFGGLNDVSILTGHSETYIGSKPGKFVEILGNAGCMNPIIYCDEIDKISTNKGLEINGILTHLLDEEQNDKFQDNYLSNININLSQVFFVIAFNDFDKVDKIVSDRMKVIYIDPPQLKDKVIIATEKMIPDIIQSFNFKKDKYINLDIELIEYIISNKVPHEDGVRQLRRCLEKIFSKLNLLILTGKYKDDKSNFTITIESEKECINIKKQFIDFCLEKTDDKSTYMNMYI